MPIFKGLGEEYAEAQAKLICDNEVVDDSTICMMTDIYLGKIAPIGLSMTVTDKVIPQLLGVDIGFAIRKEVFRIIYTQIRHITQWWELKNILLYLQYC